MYACSYSCMCIFYVEPIVVSFSNNLITGVPGVISSVAADLIIVTIKRMASHPHTELGRTT